ncbi:hypothetical protein M405DRAFT_690366, partial [Rhizopogon salebrosus TDB-379]
MIALCRAKCCIVQLREEGRNIPNAQRGLMGNIMVFPQQASKVAEVLPPTLEDIITPICVLFVGSKPPSPDWLKRYAKPLIVRKEKVLSALRWLRDHNRHYRDISIDASRLDCLEDEQVLPVHVEVVPPSREGNVLTSRYDTDLDAPVAESIQTAANIGENVVVAGVDGNAPPHELRAAALKHVKDQGGRYVQIPHESSPANEFVNPALFPLIYPTLFPYGLGGFEHPRRSSKLSLKRQAKH